MVRLLRQRHRIAVSALSVLLPAAFVLGIGSRHSLPPAISLPAAFENKPPAESLARWSRNDLWEKEQLNTRLLEDPARSNLSLEVTAPESTPRPDVLLYWSFGNGSIEDSLPKNAIFLGAWSQQPGSNVELPSAARGEGKLILYSLADHEIVNISKSFSIQ